MTRCKVRPRLADRCSRTCLGWGIFNGNEIQRCDECHHGKRGPFEDDDAARAHVAKCRPCRAVVRKFARKYGGHVGRLLQSPPPRVVENLGWSDMKRGPAGVTFTCERCPATAGPYRVRAGRWPDTEEYPRHYCPCDG